MTATRDRILDAARTVTVEQGWSAVTMARLGQAAGVSRQSVYNEFGSKQQVAQALMDREVAAFLVAVDEGLATGSTPDEAVEAAADAVFGMAQHNPLVHATLSAAAGSPSPLLPLLTSQSAPVISTAVDRVSSGLHARFPDLDLVGLRPAVDVIVRLVLSHVVQPGEPPDMGLLAKRLLVDQ